ncbi:MAG: hypothetical protein KY475_01225 [Planctomycetes bacterium]|nr:hypothetical protein [Planctomycetota bacterium]
MRTVQPWKHVVMALGLAALGGLLSGRPLPAAKPGGGGGDSLSGTIYFVASGTTSTMSPDGSNKAALSAGVSGEPGRLLHGGYRWFLQSRNIPDETYPNGAPRRELFAVRDDGDETFTVQLTNDATLQFTGLAHWAPGETADSAMIGVIARRWTWDGAEWVIDPDSPGVYAATAWFDADGNVLGLDAPPSLLVSLGVAPSEKDGSWYADAYGAHFDWSPDLLEIVCSNSDRSELRSVDVLSGAIRVLTTGGFPSYPVWSPADDWIAFSNGDGSIERIRPNGDERKVIIRADTRAGYFDPTWSPTGSYLVYTREPWGDPWDSDLYRATASGSSKTNLTSDIPGPVSPIAWR